MSESGQNSPRVAVIGGGPAGLMAAEILAQQGVRVELYDAMPSVGRKFLMAGKGGMNITHAEPLENLLSRYGTRRAQLEPMVRAFSPQALRAWMQGLGIDSFVGSSGRVFPAGMKAAPLLRAWLHRLREQGVHFHVRHRWCGWDADGALRFEISQSFSATPSELNKESLVCSLSRLRERGGERASSGEGANVKTIYVSAVVLALGGGSWPQLGSDGAWLPLLAQRGIAAAPLRPANCGFDVNWSPHFSSRYAGEPLKSVAASCAGHATQRGECVVTARGIEGGLIYALSAALRDEIERAGHATLQLDLLPDWPLQRVLDEVAHPRGPRSLSSHLQSRLGLKGVKANLLREALSADDMNDPARLAATIKSLPLRLIAPRPLAEAISSAGGVAFDALDGKLMLRELPGVFCAGEMLDWEAPTGGYLLTGCFASGRAAALGVLDWLAEK
ncbi:MAG TPA: TIGR03862 family flavoprotein [Gallionella sp.]|nr:TIGR03862 family flavoprotein [Gallionella sp.]